MLTEEQKTDFFDQIDGRHFQELNQYKLVLSNVWELLEERFSSRINEGSIVEYYDDNNVLKLGIVSVKNRRLFGILDSNNNKDNVIISKITRIIS